MKNLLTLIVVMLIAFTTSEGTTYYVSLSGDDSNSGTTIATAWRTITYAATQAQAGDSVHIEAGDYGHEHVVLMNSGTARNPIVFQGYQYTPGDTPEPYYEPGDSLDPTVMPVINGTDRTGNGIYSYSKNYIDIKNIQVTLYQYGIVTYYSDFIIVDNVIAIRFGGEGYDGYGIFIRQGSHCEIRNSTVTDSRAINIDLSYSYYSLVENCESHNIECDMGPLGNHATDYYIAIYYGHDNTIRNCFAQNHHTTVEDVNWGHGIGVKYGYNNTIIDCIARGFSKSFYISRPTAHDNEIINCTAFDDSLSLVVPPDQGPGGLVVRDGAYNNTFIDCRVVQSRNGIWFWDSGGVMGGGTGNSFINCILEDVETGIHLEEAYNNVFENCVITGAENLLGFSFSNDNNNMMNSIVTDVNSYITGAGVVAITYSDFYNNGFTTPPGTGNLEEDPLFVYAIQNDYRLQWGSPCIDAGDPDPQYNDPDGTRADMGASFYDQSLPVRILLTPHNIPIEIPPEGGSFNYTIWLTNIDPAPPQIEAWIDGTLPDGTVFGPLLGPVTVALDSGVTVDRERTQFVPAGAPTGTYFYNAYAIAEGDTSTDSFTFVKLGADGSDALAGWFNTGDSFLSEVIVVDGTLPEEFALYVAFPNPFNSSTTLSYSLPKAGKVSLVIYDVMGREAARLVDSWTPAGVYQMTFDAATLSSGIYFARMMAGDFQQTRKLLLLR